MAKKLERIISKEDAVFWLDDNGRWHNEHGEFENKKIIDFFHDSIRHDSAGYYLTQDMGSYMERVYFPYKDTALFVFDIKDEGDYLTMTFNTKEEMRLRPRRLFLEDDNLYVQLGRQKAKFVNRALLSISNYLKFDEKGSFLEFDDKKYKIREL